MFDLGEEQALSPIPRSPKNQLLQESFYSVATEGIQQPSSAICIPRFKACKLISYIFARENNEVVKSLPPDSPINAKDAYQALESPVLPVIEIVFEQQTSAVQVADSEHGGQEIRTN